MSVRVLALDAVPIAPDPLEPEQVLGGDPATEDAPLLVLQQGATAGIWRCAPGRFRDVELDEAFVVLQGSATIEPVDGEPVRVGPGDVCVLEAGTRTVWTVHEPLVKLYCVAAA